MSWAEERRQNKLIDAQIAREDAATAAQVRMAERAAVAAERRADEQARTEARRAAVARRQERWAAWVAGGRAWAAEHVVDLLIYPLAVVSAVLAVPAMAAYGYRVYGNGPGYALFAITELGMWAFALAVQITRRRYPGRRPVWALQTGVWVFAAVAFGINALHGAERGLDAAVVMGVGSVAGVMAHQLITAGHRRSRPERAEARIARRATRKIAGIRRAAVAQAVAEIDHTGAVRLVFAPGRYVIGNRGRFGKRGYLETAIVPGLPIEPTATEWDRELADLLANPAVDMPAERAAIEPRESGDDTVNDANGGGTVATVDDKADQDKSSPNRDRIPDRRTRSIAELRAELAKALKARPGSIDPTKAESIRKALRCSPARARKLRDEHLQGGQQ